MKSRAVVIGRKYTPTKKTCGCILEDCVNWKNRDGDYLYVTQKVSGIEGNDEPIFILSVVTTGGGSFYYADDFEPYDEKILVSKSEYDDMRLRNDWLNSLEATGVDNWEGMEEAGNYFRETYPEWDDEH